MIQIKQALFTAIILLAGITAFPQKDGYQKGFMEDFKRSHPRNFQSHTGSKGADLTCKSGVRSPTERKAKILSFKIDPEVAAGAGKGPEIISRLLHPFRNLCCTSKGS